MTEQQVIDEYADRFSTSSGQCGVSSDVSITGYAKFRADGTFQIDEVDGTTIGYSETCLGGIGQTCDSIRHSFMSGNVSSDISQSCQSVGGICTCVLLYDHGVSFGSYTTDSSSEYHLSDVDGADRGDRQYCIQGDVFSVFAPSDTIGGGGILIAVRAADSSVADVDASVVLPHLDASTDASVDRLRVDATGDVSLDSARRDASDAPVDASTDRPKVDATADSSRIDAGAVDAQPVDATPLPLDALPPSMVVACQLAAVAPCGGDVTGSWKMVGNCDPWLSETELIADQNQSCITEADMHSTGTAVFGTDGTCSVSEDDTYDNWYATSCLSANNDTCSALDRKFMSAIGSDAVIDAGCVSDTVNTCHCDDVYRYPNPTCTYSTAESELTFISAPGAFQVGAFDYCVQGDTLSIFFTPTSATGKACVECSAAVVMTRSNPLWQ